MLKKKKSPNEFDLSSRGVTSSRDITTLDSRIPTQAAMLVDRLSSLLEEAKKCPERTVVSIKRGNDVQSAHRRTFSGLIYQGNSGTTIGVKRQWSEDLKDSFARISMWESSGIYIPGTSQSMTWLLHYMEGRLSRSEAAWSRRGEQDAGALAPLNLTSSRLVTLYEAKPSSRMSLRFLFGMIYSRWMGLSHHITEELQYGAITALPHLPLTKEDHKDLWINYPHELMTLNAQKKWPPIEVIIKKSGVLVDSEERWML